MRQEAAAREVNMAALVNTEPRHAQALWIHLTDEEHSNDDDDDDDGDVDDGIKQMNSAIMMIMISNIIWTNFKQYHQH